MKATAKKQSAITPIKLVMSLIVIGVSAVTTFPKLVDMSADGQMASVKSTVVVVASGEVANYK